MKVFRLIRSKPATAVYNMALDEKIFNQYLLDGVPVLRVYGWSAPSFTYGFSQKPQEELDLPGCARAGVEVVKRMTGGGILFHHDEITYSFVCSKQDVGEEPGVFVSYRRICAFLIRFYKSLSLKVSFAIESESFKSRSLPQALCSASNEKYDIIINDKKIGGNAQKRRRQAVFQHGAIPCSIDWELVSKYIRVFPKNMPEEITTLSQELAHVPDKAVLEEKLIEAFGNEFGARFLEEEKVYCETGVA
ncbi:MAG: lipoate--protein ligase family protein [Candidatus Omnitrophica bacterium]|nr:lipoate--protein ligase family protein [Candidatus Omnitrophota bacterium]